MSRHDVLILCADVLAAALLGAAVELVGHQPHFAEPSEAARDALRRVRPGAVVVDCDHTDACADAFLGPALMTGARLLLIGSRSDGSEGEVVARRLDLDVLRLPQEYDRLLARLRDPEG